MHLETVYYFRKERNQQKLSACNQLSKCLTKMAGLGLWLGTGLVSGLGLGTIANCAHGRRAHI